MALIVGYADAGADGDVSMTEHLQTRPDALRGKSLEDCLAAQPVEEVPVFRKKVRI